MRVSKKQAIELLKRAGQDEEAEEIQREVPADNKFGNEITDVDGIKFHSGKEARRYAELKLLERAGAIKNLRLQPKYLLHETQRASGRTFKKVHYIADFEYVETFTGITVTEDVKSKATMTSTFMAKVKVFLAKYPHLEFRIID